MIVPLSSISPDTGYQFPNLYGIRYGVGRTVQRQPAVLTPPVRTEVLDMVTLSPAAQRIMEQAERLKQEE